MVLHAPQPWAKVNQSDDRYVEENREAWRASGNALKAGKLRAGGVSNFPEGDINSLLEACEIKPMVNQILCHIGKAPKTANPEHMKASAGTDFAISDEDMDILMNMEEIEDREEFGMFPVYGGGRL